VDWADAAVTARSRVAVEGSDATWVVQYSDSVAALERYEFGDGPEPRFSRITLNLRPERLYVSAGGHLLEGVGQISYWTYVQSPGRRGSR